MLTYVHICMCFQGLLIWLHAEQCLLPGCVSSSLHVHEGETQTCPLESWEGSADHSGSCGGLSVCPLSLDPPHSMHTASSASLVCPCFPCVLGVPYHLGHLPLVPSLPACCHLSHRPSQDVTEPVEVGERERSLVNEETQPGQDRVAWTGQGSLDS